MAKYFRKTIELLLIFACFFQSNSTMILLENKFDLEINQTLLSQVDSGYPSSIDSIAIVRCSITKISKYPFSNYTLIDFLFVKNSGLTTLPSDLFTSNILIQSIYLTESNITTIEEGIFSKSINLRVLDLSLNKIITLPQTLFNETVLLTKFVMQRNELKELPEGIFDDASQLKTIDLAYNKIKRIPSNLFKYNYQLESVNLQGNRIKHLDHAFEHLLVKYFKLNSNSLDVGNKKVKEILKIMHTNGIKTGIQLPHHVHDEKHENHETTHLLIALIFMTVLLSALVGYLIVAVKKSGKGNCSKYQNMRTMSREVIFDEPWAETEMNGNIIRQEN